MYGELKAQTRPIVGKINNADHIRDLSREKVKAINSEDQEEIKVSKIAGRDLLGLLDDGQNS